MTTHHDDAINTGLRRPVRAAIALLALGGLAFTPVHAKTAGEAALAASPLPHERLGAGRDSVKVHWVRLQGYFEGANGHAAMLDDLKAQVQSCVRAANLAGRRARPSLVWPEYVNSTQRDTYDSENRSISYGTTLLYTVNPSDCSLLENRRTVATLTSTKGICEIDLGSKTAHGLCDTRAHADAPPMLRTGAPAPDGRTSISRAPNRAALDALERAMKLAPRKSSEHKTILGIECDVWKTPFDPNGTACLSRGGSFVAAHATSGLTGSSMELEITSTLGVNLHAVKAALDAKVNANVFAPYLTDGFEVTNVGGRK
jgi:hypothetical protein